MHFVYIIKSENINSFYIGETSDIDQRIIWHNTGQFKNAHTKIADDWKLFYKIECSDISQARKIEKHIKNMKSRKYIENLLIHTEITTRLLNKYK